jgi:hypothetical protein
MLVELYPVFMLFCILIFVAALICLFFWQHR